MTSALGSNLRLNPLPQGKVQAEEGALGVGPRPRLEVGPERAWASPEAPELDLGVRGEQGAAGVGEAQ